MEQPINPELIGPEITPRPTIEEVREFVRLPWVRCVSCGRVTGNKQEQFDQILADKEKTYYDAFEETYNQLIEQGQPEAIAEQLADRSAQIRADVTFNKKVAEELKIPADRYCCYRTLMNPIILPLGAGVELDPDVEVGERMSKLRVQEEPEVLPLTQGEQETKPRNIRVYRAV